MRALVTGAAGFIGSHLCEELIARGWDVVGLDDGSARAAWDAPMPMHPKMTGAVTSVSAFRRYKPAPPLDGRFDAVFHLAARIGVDSIVRDPLRMLREHADDIWTLCDGALGCNAVLLITSSSEVYGSNEWCDELAWLKVGPTHENRNGYAVTKLYQEHVALRYAELKGLRVVLPRLFNVAGPRQRADDGCVLSRFVKRALSGEPIEVHGDGDHRRSFAHVKDVAAALAALAEKRIAGQTFDPIVNVGVCDPVSIAELAERVATHVARTYRAEPSVVTVPFADLPPHAARERMAVRVPRVQRLKSILGSPLPSRLGDIIADTAAWWASILNVERRET